MGGLHGVAVAITGKIRMEMHSWPAGMCAYADPFCFCSAFLVYATDLAKLSLTVTGLVVTLYA